MRPPRTLALSSVRQIHRDATNALESARTARRGDTPRLEAVHLHRPDAAAPPPPDAAVLSQMESTRTAKRSGTPPRLQAVHLHRETEVKVEGGVEVQRMRRAPSAAAGRLQAIHMREKEGGDLRTRHLEPGGGDRAPPPPPPRKGLFSWLRRS